MTYSDTIEALQAALNTAAVLSQLTGADRGHLFLLARARETPAGQLLFAEGDLSTDEVVLVVEGDMELLRKGSADVDETLAAPQFLGEIGPSTQGRRRRTIRAKTPLYSLAWPIDTLARDAPDTAKRFIEAIEARAFARLATDLNPS